MVAAGSYPIRVYNGGTKGTDPVLERVLHPGDNARAGLLANTSGTANGTAYSAAAGLWNWTGSLSSATRRPMLVSLTANVRTAAVTSAAALGTVHPTTMYRSCFLSPTAFIHVWSDASNNIKAIACKLSADGQTWTPSAETTLVANGGAVLKWPMIIPITSITAALIFWDNTNTLNKVGVVTYNPATPSLSIGTINSDTGTTAPLNPTQNQIATTLDYSGNGLWLSGVLITSAKVAAEYWSLSAGTFTCSASINIDNGTTPGGSITTQGYSFAANKILLDGNTPNTSPQNCKRVILTFTGPSALAITTTIVNDNQSQSYPATNRWILPIDASSNVFMSLNGGGSNKGQVAIARMDLTGPTLYESRFLYQQVYPDNPSSTIPFDTTLWCPVSDGEIFHTQSSTSSGMCRLDARALYNRCAVASAATSPRSLNFEPTSRRLALVCQDYLGNSSNYVPCPIFYEVPRR